VFYIIVQFSASVAPGVLGRFQADLRVRALQRSQLSPRLCCAFVGLLLPKHRLIVRICRDRYSSAETILHTKELTGACEYIGCLCAFKQVSQKFYCSVLEMYSSNDLRVGVPAENGFGALSA